MPTNMFIKGEAVFSPCGLYRYTLKRRWDRGPYVNFICLNPSTADAEVDDPTIYKCMKFADSWGFRAMLVTNLFAYRSTDPKGLLDVDDPVGMRNDYWLEQVAMLAGKVVCAWSQEKVVDERARAVLKFLPRPLWYLKLSRQPHHPLYLRDDSQPVYWDI